MAWLERIFRKPVLPEIPRPIAISYSQKDFWLTYRIARALGMGRSENHQAGRMGNIWFQFPNPALIPPYEKLDFVSVVLPTSSHWGLDVLPAFIAHSEALVVILTSHSSRSEQVHLEIRTYPECKPIWLISIADEPMPERWKIGHKAHVIKPPVSIDLKKMFEMACSRAADATNKGLHTEAYLFYWDAINLLALVNPHDVWRGYNLFALKGQCEIRLGLGRGAVESFESALSLAGAMQGQESYERFVKENPTGELVIRGGQPACAMQAHILRDLGAAHMIARDEHATGPPALYGLPLSIWEESIRGDKVDGKPPVDPNARAGHLAAAQACWRKCLTILEKHSGLLTRLSRFPYEDLKRTCTEFLARSEGEE